MNIPGSTRLKNLTTRQRYAAGGIVLAAIALFIALGIGTGDTSIGTVPVARGDFIIDIRTRGELKAARSVSVTVPARVYGNMRIVSIVEDGIQVNEGDFLVQFDTSEFQNRVEERRNALETARAELESQKANINSTMNQLQNSYLTQQYSYEQAKLRFEQMKYEAEARKREEELNFKKAELALEQAKEKIEAQKILDESTIRKAELRVKQEQSRFDEAVQMLESLTLTAPKSGMVVLQKIYNNTGGYEKIKVGDTPHRGMDLIAIPDLSRMLVTTQVSEVDISRVALGQRVLITLDAMAGPVFYGTVTSVAKLARTEPGSEIKVFDVEVTIEGQDERLKPGMTAQCRIITDTVSDVLYVPLESVFARDDTTVVFVKGHGFGRREVTTGKKNSDYIVIADGVAEGDEVALRDPTVPLEELGRETRANGGPGI